MSQETTIKDVDGDEFRVTWEPMRTGIVVAIEPSDPLILLDLSGIAKLRAALDEAEAAFRLRQGGDP